MIFFVNETHQDFMLDLVLGTNNELGSLRLTYEDQKDGKKTVSSVNLMYVSEENSDATLEMLTGRMEKGNVAIPKKHTTKLCPVGNKMVVVYTPGNGAPYDSADNVVDKIGCIQKHTPVEYNDARSLVVILTEDRPGYNIPSVTIHTDCDDDSPVTEYCNRVWNGFNITEIFIREAKWQKLQQYNVVIGNLPNGDRFEAGAVSVVKDGKKSVVNALMRYDRNGIRVMDKVAAKKSGHYHTTGSSKGTKNQKTRNGESRDKAKKPYNKKPYNGKQGDGKKPYTKSSENNKQHNSGNHTSSSKPEFESRDSRRTNDSSFHGTFPDKKSNERRYQERNVNKKNTSKGLSKLEKNKRKFS